MCNIHGPNENITWKLSTMREQQQWTPKGTKWPSLLLSPSRQGSQEAPLHNAVWMIFNDRKRVNKKPVWNQRILGWNKWILWSVKYLNEVASWHKEMSWFQIFTLEKGWFDSKGLIRQWKAWWKGLCRVGRSGKPQSPMAISHLCAAAAWSYWTCSCWGRCAWHTAPCLGKGQQPCTPEKAQCPEDLNRNSERGFTNLQRVSNRSLQCSTRDCYCLKTASILPVISWHQSLVSCVAARLYGFNRNLITLPVLAFITKPSSIGPCKNIMQSI